MNNLPTIAESPAPKTTSPSPIPICGTASKTATTIKIGITKAMWRNNTLADEYFSRYVNWPVSLLSEKLRVEYYSFGCVLSLVMPRTGETNQKFGVYKTGC